MQRAQSTWAASLAVIRGSNPITIAWCAAFGEAGSCGARRVAGTAGSTVHFLFCLHGAALIFEAARGARPAAAVANLGREP